MKTAIIINSESFGKGDDELGKKLMGAFLRKLWVRKEQPEYLLFYNSGVKLLGKDSEIMDVLSGISEKGAELVACGTCIDHYNLKDQLFIGRKSDMAEIVEIISKVDKVITV